MKIYQAIEQLFGFQINSTQEIPSYMNLRSNTGKFDEPKKEALIIMLLSRVAKLEDKVEQLEIVEVTPVSMPVPEVAVSEPVKRKRRKKKLK